MQARWMMVAAMGTLLLVGNGCLITSSSKETHEGNYVSVNTFNQIKPGETTAGWVKAILGNPSTVTPLENGREIWRYQYTEHKSSSGTVLFIFAGSGTKESTQAAYVEFKDGVVTNAWRG